MRDESILKSFRARKVLTIDELARLLASSTVTARRRLKKWSAYTSINRNGRYYVLPEIVRFDKNGLWSHNMIFFSKHGNLQKTIVQLIKDSQAGLTAQQIVDLVGLQSNSSFLSGCRNISGVYREKHQGRYIYFFDEEDIYFRQKEKREHLHSKKERLLPSDSDAVLILVDRIKYPDAPIEQCAHRIGKRIRHISISHIQALLDYHGLLKKTQDTPQSRH